MNQTPIYESLFKKPKVNSILKYVQITDKQRLRATYKLIGFPKYVMLQFLYYLFKCIINLSRMIMNLSDNGIEVLKLIIFKIEEKKSCGIYKVAVLLNLVSDLETKK